MLTALFVIASVLLIIAAIVFLCIGFDSESVIAFGIAFVCVGVAYVCVAQSVHRFHVRSHNRHVGIMRDLRDQGFTVDYGNVYALGGHYLAGTTEVDLRAGRCLLPFIARKVNGVWHAAQPTSPSGYNDVALLTPQKVAAMGAVCR